MIKKGEYYYPSKDFSKKALLSDKDIYSQAEKDPIKFWDDLAKDLVWRKKWKKTFVHNPPYFEWFVGGKINITENCLDRHLEDKKNKVALIWEPENPEETPRYLTYYDLHREVSRFANGLKKIGVKKGDKVIIYLPVICEAVIAMLACARIGAIHSVVFSAFSPLSLRARIDDTGARFLITADGYYRRGEVIDLKKSADEAMRGSKIKKSVIVERAKNKISWNKERDIWWKDVTKDQSDSCEAEEMDSEEPLFILYNSGSLGKPKEVVHTCGGYTVQSFYSGRWIFDLKDSDIFWSTADIGWITGHTYSVYTPLLNGATVLIFEGAPDWPEASRWCQIIEKYGVTIFYTAPTAVRMFKKQGSVKKESLKTLRILGSVGEMIDQDSWLWFFNEIGGGRCPIVDTWWQTETGSILVTSLPGIGPFRPAFAGRALPGIKMEVFNEKGDICKPNEQGDLVLLPPFSPSMMRIVYNKKENRERYIKEYWTRHGKENYFTLDLAFKDEKGLIRVVGRDDDVIKVAGHRISTGEMEDAISKLSFISENAVVGLPDKIKGEVPVSFIVTKKETEDYEKKVIAQIRKEIGPIALPQKIYSVKALPKTRSGKTMRRILKGLLTGQDLGDTTTLVNPESIDQLKKATKDD